MTRNFISREAVLELLDLAANGIAMPQERLLRDAIKSLPYFPAPNPNEENGRNLMGQTEEEFWDAVERTQSDITEQNARVRVAMEHLRKK